MKMKRIISSALVSLLILSALISCGESAETQTPGQSSETAQASSPETAEETTEAVKYTLPSTDYGGREFHLLAGDEYDNFSFVEEETGEVLNDAKFAMQRTLENGLKVKIIETRSPFWEMNNTVKQLVLSGDTTYNSIAMMDRFAVQAAQAGYFMPIQDVSTVDLTQPYWGNKLSASLSIGHRQYFAVNSGNLKAYQKIHCMLMNTRLAENYGITVPYDDVIGGSWTFDKLLSYRGIADADLNGNGQLDVNDSFTYMAGDIRGLLTFWLVAFGQRNIEKDADDIPYLTVYDNERYIDIVGKIYDLYMTGTNDLTNVLKRDGENGVEGAPTFRAGHALIMDASIASLVTLRDMEDDFAVLTMPKYDESQADYMSHTIDVTYHSVPVTEADPEFSGAVLDAMSCVGYYDLLPVYMETVLKDKFARDERSRETVQICFDTRMVDLSESILSDFFMDEKVYDMFVKGPENVVSKLEKSRSKAEKALSKAVEKLTEEG